MDSIIGAWHSITGFIHSVVLLVIGFLVGYFVGKFTSLIGK